MKLTHSLLGCLFVFLTGCKKEDVELSDNSLINIPDAGFESYLIQLSIDSDKQVNGHVAFGDLRKVEKLSLIVMGNSPIIKSLKGIESFTNLTYLNCSGWAIDKLDVSQNAKLEYLNCSSTPSAGEGYTPSAQIRQLTFGEANTKLSYLNCNRTATTALDLSKLVGLTQLFCVSNSLTELDVSKNKFLQYCWTYGSPQLKTTYVSSFSQIDSTISQAGPTNGSAKWSKDPLTAYKIVQ